jgi:hypothetical protein
MSFEILPRDVLLFILAKVGDPSKLFCCSKYLNEFGKKHQLRAKELALNEITKIAPYASIIGCPQCNLSMIKRGQETAYTAILECREEPDQYLRHRTYFMNGFTLGFVKSQIFDDVHPYFSLKGPPARKGSQISLFCLIQDTPEIRVDDGNPYVIEGSKFEFEYATRETLEKTSIWESFCEFTVSEQHWEERQVILSEFDRHKEERDKEKEEFLKTLTAKQQDEWLKSHILDNPFEENVFNQSPKYKDIYRRLGEFDNNHREAQEILKEHIYSDKDTIVKTAKKQLIETGRYESYIFGVYSFLEK